MKNKLFQIFFFLLISLNCGLTANTEEQFSFDVSEIKITQDGNKFLGLNRGIINVNNGIKITADKFEYNKIDNLLKADGNVSIYDADNDYKILTENILYDKNAEIISGKNKLKIVNNNIEITANKFEYNKNKNLINAYGNVNVIDKLNNYKIYAENIFYIKKEEKFVTKGFTEANIQSKYFFKSKDITFLKEKMNLSSSYKSTLLDNTNMLFEFDKFNYDIKKEFLKAKNININENIKILNSNKLFFSSGFFDFKNNYFKTAETKILLKKDLFGNLNNDPRLIGVSSTSRDGITVLEKSIFTSCNKNEKCPPWSLKAKKITHNKKKKRLSYEGAILQVYDVPIFYFPKFFHPDPTVKRQSGFLQPQLGKSDILGTSFSLPYYYAISDNKDLTFKPSFFSENIQMFQNEYRQKNQNSSLVADFGFTKGFKSTVTQKKKNIGHLFAKFEKNLNLKSYTNSNINFFIERINKDTYLKIFDGNLFDSKVKPQNFSVLNSGFNFSLEHDQYNLSGGANIYEDLEKKNSDRYQYVLPFFNLSKDLLITNYGNVKLETTGNNILSNTNNLKTRLINDVKFSMNEKIFQNLGIKNNFNLYLKNLNTLGKNDENYKSSPQLNLQSLMEFKSELPLLKTDNESNNYLIPKLSLKINPGDMKSYSNLERKINTDNIFSSNRLGLSESFESGESLTLGLDYKQENKKDNDKYLEMKIASVFRKNIENHIPSSSTLNKKNSNLFGSIDYGLSNNVKLNYGFSIDNKFESFQYNQIGLDFSMNNFVTKFNFIEEDASIGNTNILENTTTYNFDVENSISFKTRRNREINLTEYYNLVYEYKNDCLKAGIEYKKTYYEDREVKPSDNLMFMISFIPLTSIEQSIK